MVDPTEMERQPEQIHLNPDPSVVGRYFGGNRNYRPDEQTFQEITEFISLARELVTPRIAWSVFPATPRPSDHCVILPGGRVFPLPGNAWSDQICLLACAVGTLGSRLETECRTLADGLSIYRSTLLDAVGTAMLDNLSQEIQTWIRRFATARNLHSGMRLAPGIDGIPMEIQAILLDLVDAGSLHIRITDAMMMEPVKSISCYIPIGPCPLCSGSSHKCRQCRLTSCQYRL